jgi:hypothetical protein
VFHIVIEAPIPKDVVCVQFEETRLGKDPKIQDRWLPQPNGAFRTVATTIGQPNVKIGDFLPIQVFYPGDPPPAEARLSYLSANWPQKAFDVAPGSRFSGWGWILSSGKIVQGLLKYL